MVVKGGGAARANGVQSQKTRNGSKTHKRKKKDARFTQSSTLSVEGISVLSGMISHRSYRKTLCARNSASTAFAPARNKWQTVRVNNHVEHQMSEGGACCFDVKLSASAPGRKIRESITGTASKQNDKPRPAENKAWVEPKAPNR